MTPDVAVRPSELLNALGRTLNSTSGLESGSPLEDPDKEDFRRDILRAQAVLANHPGKDNVFGSMDDRMVSRMQCYLAREGTSHGALIASTGDGFEAKFDNLDPGWFWSLHKWIKQIAHEPFVEAPAEPVPIANDYRLAVLSDWGTGAYGAPVCSHSIARDPEKIDLVLHLGDVYYAGDIDETQTRFLAHWPSRTGALNRALNGNHEMYTGGRGYFKLILERFKQPASYFAFCNEDFLLVGLDTAFEEHDFYGQQMLWLDALTATHPRHRILLFTHHQPFSYFEGRSPKLEARLNRLLMKGRIAAWYWGHEHSCTVYDLHEPWQMYGRCVGHSGFPYFRRQEVAPPGTPAETNWRKFPKRNDVPGCRVLDGANPYVKPSPQLYGPNGYLTLELRGPKVHETYRSPEGHPLMEFDF